MFNPKTRKYVWDVCKKNYYDYGVYDFDHYRYIEGPALSCSNIYPQLYSRVFYDNMKDLGDVPSTFEAFYDQLQAGLNMGLAGIPWWTTDIGGFMTDDVNDPDFQQLLIRWYEFAVYSAVLRMHGDRGPYNIPMLDDRDFGGGCLHTGQPNELWSYGEENYKIMKKYYDIRIEMHDYIKKTVRRGIRERTRDGKVYEGGQTIHADAPIDSIPAFKRK